MLLKQMIEPPITSPNLVVFDPFRAFDRDQLIREVIGLANANIEGPRHILFGINPGAIDDSNIVGIPLETIDELKRAHRLIASFVEPGLDLAFIFDRIEGKYIGALEVGGCDFGPYFVAQDLSDTLYRGACWFRRDHELLTVDRAEFLKGNVTATGEIPEVADISPDEISLIIGFNNDPTCEFIEVSVPDTSDPPFADEATDEADALKSTNLTQASPDESGGKDTQILHVKKPEESSEIDAADADDVGRKIAAAARKHYFFEERAVKVDLCICNISGIDIHGLQVTLGFPRLPGFDIADRIYTSPFDKRANGHAIQSGYPKVKRQKDAIFVHVNLASLPAGQTQQLLGTSLRLAVGPEAVGKKVALQYVLRTPNGRKLDSGRLKIRLRRRAVDVPGEDATEIADLDFV